MDHAPRKSPPDIRLWNACLHGDLAGMRLALDQGAQPDALLALAFCETTTIRKMPGLPHAKALCSLAGPAPSLVHATPSMLCASLGRDAALSLLFARGAHPNPPSKRSLAGIACARGHLPTLSVALDAGCHPATPDEHGREPLSEAVAQGRAPMTKLLLSRLETDPNAQDLLGLSALHVAAIGRRVDLIELLILRGADPNLPDNQGRTPLHRAAAIGCKATIESLAKAGARLESLDNKSRTPLMAACRVANPSGVEPLLRLGANPNTLGAHPRDPSRAPQTALGYALSWGRIPTALALLASGADPNARFSELGCEILPLERALGYGPQSFREVFSALIRAGASPDAHTSFASGGRVITRRLLNKALRGPRYHASNLALFLTANPDVEYLDEHGFTALEALAFEPEWRPPGYYSETCDALLRAGARITVRLREHLESELPASAKATEHEIQSTLRRHATARDESALISREIARPGNEAQGRPPRL